MSADLFAPATGSGTPRKSKRRVATGESCGLVGVGGDSKTQGDSLKLSRADDVRDNMPLFRSGLGGSTPTSALQLQIRQIDVHKACKLNECWHSRLPKVDWSNIVRNKRSACYAAEFNDIAFAIAIWSSPVARLLADKNWLELRRMAIADDAPKNTASRMLRVMRLMITKDMPEIVNLISYQDTEVHKGTIYAAAGWKATQTSTVNGKGWNTRERSAMQTTADKVRWEYQLKP